MNTMIMMTSTTTTLKEADKDILASMIQWLVQQEKSNLLSWENPQNGTFRIHDKEELASQLGLRWDTLQRKIKKLGIWCVPERGCPVNDRVYYFPADAPINSASNFTPRSSRLANVHPSSNHSPASTQRMSVGHPLTDGIILNQQSPMNYRHMTLKQENDNSQHNVLSSSMTSMSPSSTPYGIIPTFPLPSSHQSFSLPNQTQHLLPPPPAPITYENFSSLPPFGYTNQYPNDSYSYNYSSATSSSTNINLTANNILPPLPSQFPMPPIQLPPLIPPSQQPSGSQASQYSYMGSRYPTTMSPYATASSSTYDDNYMPAKYKQNSLPFPLQEPPNKRKKEEIEYHQIKEE